MMYIVIFLIYLICVIRARRERVDEPHVLVLLLYFCIVYVALFGLHPSLWG